MYRTNGERFPGDIKQRVQLHCITDDPQVGSDIIPQNMTFLQQALPDLSGVLYFLANEFPTNVQAFPDLIAALPLHGKRVPCSVCHVKPPQNEYLVITGTTECPAGWTKQYQGLMFGHTALASADSVIESNSVNEFICVTDDMEGLPNDPPVTTDDLDVIISPVKLECGGEVLPCDRYPNGEIVTCVACSR